MAQETGLFTVRRPRETLGSINFNSAIPQPASALKRSNSISNLKTSTTPYTTARHGRSVSSSRMSLAHNLSRPRQPSFQRSSSGNNLGFVEQSFFAQAPIPASAPMDPRPLRNGAFQAKIGQELLDYLTQNNFELDTKHALRQNMLKSPTTNDFNVIFQWLYHRIDPAYRFQKTIDTEVPPILKQLRYPYIKNISKSQLAAPGGQNWSTFLGLLHWMMQLAQMVDRYEVGQYDDACAEAGIDVSGDRIIFRFLSGAYRDWLQFDDADEENDDADKLLVPHVEAMAAEFERGNSRYAEEMQMSEAEHAALSKQIEEAERGAPDLAKLEKHFQILEDDKRKFEDYNASVEGKLEKYETRIKFLTEEIDRTEAELREAEQEKSNLQESVDRQGITIQDIDHMNTERERLQKMREVTAMRLDEVKKRSVEQEIEASRALEDLERVVEKYNSLCYQIDLIPSTASNAKGEDFELCLSTSSATSFSSSQLVTSQHGGANSDRLLEDQNTGYHHAQLLQLDLRGAVKARFISLRKEINERRTIAMDVDMKNHELLDSIKEAIDDKKGEVETLQHRVRAAEEEFERTKEITSTQKVKSDAQIEKMEKELAKMRAGLTESLQLLEQREMNTNLECEQLTLHSIALREDLHTKTERILNDIIKFKVHIQKSLEDLEGLVVEEVERELGGDDEDHEETQSGERMQWDGLEDRVDVGM